ncbi:MAG: BamA/TamA family outer membrane protein [Bacteroidales bacterium]|nr:BamA/TamA family outer membrane protein [Bacteroidales bacterium]
MKNCRLIGLIWLLSVLTSGGYSQHAVNLDVRINGPDSVPGDGILARLKLTNPVSLNYADLNPTIERIIGFYENAGYPFVQVRLDSLNPKTQGLSGVLSINPGELVIFDTLLNRTGYRISAPVLYRLMNIRPGDPYSESALSEATARLVQTTFLKQKRPMEVGFHPGKASIYFYPEKAGANRFDGWIGLSPSSGEGGKLAFSGALTLNLSNMIGQGENWQFDWHRSQDASQKLNMAAELPYLAGLPFGVKGNFGLFRQDTSYLNLSWEAGIPYYFNPKHLLSILIRHKESSILSSDDTPNSIIQPFSSMLSGVQWELSHLDNPVNPYRGFLLKAEATTGHKSIGDSISMQQSEFLADFSWFQPLAKNLTFDVILHGGYQKSPESYQNEQYRLGGINLLRGFDEDVFYADAYAVSSLELRYLLDQTSHLILLMDLGYLQTKENEVNTWKTPLGLGLGGQIRTAGGIFRIICAIGKEGDTPFNFRNTKIHLGYVGVF